MDLLDGAGYYSKWFDLRQTKPINDAWEMMDIDNKNFILNSGSYFIIQTGLLVFYLIRFIINSLAACCPKYKRVQKVGMWAFEESYF